MMMIGCVSHVMLWLKVLGGCTGILPVSERYSPMSVMLSQRQGEMFRCLRRIGCAGAMKTTLFKRVAREIIAQDRSETVPCIELG